MIDVVPCSTIAELHKLNDKQFTNYIVDLFVSDLQGLEAVHVAHVIEDMLAWKTTRDAAVLEDAMFHIEHLTRTTSTSLSESAVTELKQVAESPMYVTEGYLGKV